MQRINAYLLIVIILFVVKSDICAQQTNEGLGEKLTKELWTLVKAGEIDPIAERFAEGFLSLHSDRPRDKAEEIKLLKTVKLRDYTLTEFVESRIGNTIYVIYKVTSDQEIAGHKIIPAYRMTVWQNVNDAWMVAAHCNMSPLKK